MNIYHTKKKWKLFLLIGAVTIVLSHYGIPRTLGWETKFKRNQGEPGKGNWALGGGRKGQIGRLEIGTFWLRNFWNWPKFNPPGPV